MRPKSHASEAARPDLLTEWKAHMQSLTGSKLYLNGAMRGAATAHGFGDGKPLSWSQHSPLTARSIDADGSAKNMSALTASSAALNSHLLRRLQLEVHSAEPCRQFVASARELIVRRGRAPPLPQRAAGHRCPQPDLPWQHGFGEEQIIGQLRRVKWFSALPYNELQVLCRRGRHAFYVRYGTIMREGNEGVHFYVLLHGRVQVTSIARGFSIVLDAGVSFGEGALITTVRREATIVALDECYLLKFASSDMVGLSIDLGEVKPHVIALMLQKTVFFNTLMQV